MKTLIVGNRTYTVYKDGMIECPKCGEWHNPGHTLYDILPMVCKHCHGEVQEIDEGSHFTAIHSRPHNCFDKLGEDDVEE